MQFSIEDLETGRFAHVAWVHGGLLDFRAASDERDDLYNRVGDAFVAIHLWSADSDVGKQVVLPFVEEFEPRLLNGDLTKTLNHRPQSSVEGSAGSSLLTQASDSSELVSETLTQPRLSQQGLQSNTGAAASNTGALASTTGAIAGNTRAAAGNEGTLTGNARDVANAINVASRTNQDAAGARTAAIDNVGHATEARNSAASNDANVAAGSTSQVAGATRSHRRRRTDAQSA